MTKLKAPFGVHVEPWETQQFLVDIINETWQGLPLDVVKRARNIIATSLKIERLANRVGILIERDRFDEAERLLDYFREKYPMTSQVVRLDTLLCFMRQDND